MPGNLLTTEQRDCDHVWRSNSRKGGEPYFKDIAFQHIGPDPMMYSHCIFCNVGTYFTQPEWEALPEGKTNTQFGGEVV